jgi:hypothetical protein
MVILDCDFEGTAGIPLESHSPLVVYTDGVRAFSIAFQCFQSIAGRNQEILQPGCGIQILELSLSDAPQLGRETTGRRAGPVEKQVFG